MRRFLAAPEWVQTEFMRQLGREVRAERDFDRWLEAQEVDDVPAARPRTVLPRRPLRWDEHWTQRARRPTPDYEGKASREQFDGIPPTTYVPALTGKPVNPNRPVPCPLPDHEERTASFHVYPGNRGWYCYGCSRGGDLFTLAGIVWGISPRGRGFNEICRRLGGVLT